MIAVVSLVPVQTAGADSKKQYFKAEACYRELKGKPQLMKYRDRWLQCIDEFESVYRLDPAGAWAAAGLYMSGQLYLGLAQRSYLDSDRQEAADRFERVIKQFPDSRYRPKAEKELGSISRKPAKPVQAKETAQTEEAYSKADACYRDLQGSVAKMKYRHNWLQCIEQSQRVYEQDPDGPRAAAGLYLTGQLYQGLYHWSKNTADLHSSLSLYNQIIDKFPESQYRQKAFDDIRTLAGYETPSSSESSKTAEVPAHDGVSPPTTSSDGPVTVQNLRFWSNPNYTRLVIDTDKETGFNHHLLKKDPSINKPQRLYVDLENSKLGDDIQKVIPINDDLLQNARAGQYTSDSVRVVVDIKSFNTYKIFSLQDPFRIVIDVWGADQEESASRETDSVQISGKMNKLPKGALAKQLALGVRRIIIDPGHGGHDYGAPGYIKGVHEKDVVLQIGKRLARKIRSDLNCEVIMTRSDDRFLTLEERTALANTKNADLFISIHTNASRDRRAYGIETYFLNLATDDEAILVAARENATSTKNISDLQSILFDLMQNAKINESSRLAGYVQTSLTQDLSSKGYQRIKDKGVKQAPFYVLLGAQMPAVLIETSFISNPRECKRLIDPGYQERLCDAVVQGLKNYIRDTSPTVFLREEPSGKSSG
jgi:N-acetylmuramoyl-L-alanine amidase